MRALVTCAFKMALKLKTLKKISPAPEISGNEDLGEGPSSGPVSAPLPEEAPLPAAEARTRNHIYNQSVVSGW